jgi:hypothetical protein
LQRAVDTQRIGLIVVFDILHETEADLLFVARTACLPGLLARRGEHGEQNSCENRYNSYNDEQLNQGKTTLFHVMLLYCVAICNYLDSLLQLAYYYDIISPANCQYA